MALVLNGRPEDLALAAALAINRKIASGVGLVREVTVGPDLTFVVSVVLGYSAAAAGDDEATGKA